MNAQPQFNPKVCVVTNNIVDAATQRGLRLRGRRLRSKTGKPSTHRFSLIAAWTLALGIGCNGDLPATSNANLANGPDNRLTAKDEAPDSSDTDLAAGRNWYVRNCSVCHGKTGQGDGRSSEALHPKPRDFTQKIWQSSIDDDTLRHIIVRGGPAVGKSPLMPGSSTLAKKPKVLAGLIVYIRSLAEQTDSDENP